MKFKYEAIEHFNFMQKIYDKVPKSGFINERGEKIDLCGVFFYEEYAYTTNGHIIGRVLIKDNAPTVAPVFWKYDDISGDDIAAKFLLNIKNYCEPNDEFSNIFSEQFIKNVKTFFDKYSENGFFFRRDDLLLTMDDLYGDKEATKVKTYVNISATERYMICLDFNPLKPTPKNQPVQKTIPVFTSPSRMQNIRVTKGDCCINVYYLYNILKYSFPKESIVGIKYNMNRRAPVIIFNKQLNTFWAIIQKK